MKTNYNYPRSLVGIICFTFMSLYSNAQSRGYVDSLNIFRFNNQSDYFDSIINYVQLTSNTGSFVFALDIKNKCLSTKKQPYLKLFYSSPELFSFDRSLLSKSKIKKTKVKNYVLSKVSQMELNKLNAYSYYEFISKYVNLKSGVIYEIENVDLLNAVLYKLLSFNIGIYVNGYSGDYIIFKG